MLLDISEGEDLRLNGGLNVWLSQINRLNASKKRQSPKRPRKLMPRLVPIRQRLGRKKKPC